MVSKNQQKIGEANGVPNLPVVPTQIMIRGNVGSLDAPSASQLCIFGPRQQGIALRGSWMVSKNPQKIGEANDMPIVPTRVTLSQNVCFLDTPRTSQLYTFGSRGHGIALRGL